MDEQIERYTFDEPKSKINDSKFHTFMDLKRKNITESDSGGMGGRILIQKESKKKVSEILGPSSD